MATITTPVASGGTPLAVRRARPCSCSPSWLAPILVGGSRPNPLPGAVRARGERGARLRAARRPRRGRPAIGGAHVDPRGRRPPGRAVVLARRHARGLPSAADPAGTEPDRARAPGRRRRRRGTSGRSGRSPRPAGPVVATGDRIALDDRHRRRVGDRDRRRGERRPTVLDLGHSSPSSRPSAADADQLAFRGRRRTAVGPVPRRRGWHRARCASTSTRGSSGPNYGVNTDYYFFDRPGRRTAPGSRSTPSRRAPCDADPGFRVHVVDIDAAGAVTTRSSWRPSRASTTSSSRLAPGRVRRSSSTGSRRAIAPSSAGRSGSGSTDPGTPLVLGLRDPATLRPAVRGRARTARRSRLAARAPALARPDRPATRRRSPRLVLERAASWQRLAP